MVVCSNLKPPKGGREKGGTRGNELKFSRKKKKKGSSASKACFEFEEEKTEKISLGLTN